MKWMGRLWEWVQYRLYGPPSTSREKEVSEAYHKFANEATQLQGVFRRLARSQDPVDALVKTMVGERTNE